MRKLVLLAAVVAIAVAIAAARTADHWQELVVNGLHAAGDGDYIRAELLFNQAVHEAEAFGPTDPRLAATWNNLGVIYRRHGKSRPAEGAFRRASLIFGRIDASGMDAGNVALNLGLVLMDEALFEAAEPHLQRALDIFQTRFGATSAKAAVAFFNLGEAFRHQKKFDSAEAMFKQASDIIEANFGVASPDLAATLNGRALNFAAQGDYRRAEPMFKLALSIWGASPGTHAAEKAATLNSYETMLRQTGRIR